MASRTSRARRSRRSTSGLEPPSSSRRCPPGGPAKSPAWTTWTGGTSNWTANCPRWEPVSAALRSAVSPSPNPSPEFQGPVPGSLSTLLAWFPGPLAPGSGTPQSGKRRACVVPWHLGPLVAYYRPEGRVAQRESTRFTPGRAQVQPLPRPLGSCHSLSGPSTRCARSGRSTRPPAGRRPRASPCSGRVERFNPCLAHHGGRRGPGGASNPPPLSLRGGIRSEGIVSEFTSAQDPEGSPHALRNYRGYIFIVPASQLLRTRSLAFDRFQINLGGKHAKIEQDCGAVSGNGCRPHRPNYRAGTSRDDADLHRAL